MRTGPPSRAFLSLALGVPRTSPSAEQIFKGARMRAFAVAFKEVKRDGYLGHRACHVAAARYTTQGGDALAVDVALETGQTSCLGDGRAADTDAITEARTH
jgi:hypothetical protein